MADSWVLAVLGFLAGLAAKEAMSRVFASVGEIGFVKRECGFFAKARLDNGREIEVRCMNPEQMFPGELSYPLRIRGDLFNDTERAALFIETKVLFLHPSGPRLLVSPTILVDGKETRVFTVPARSRIDLHLEIPVTKSELLRHYAQTLPVLKLTTANKRELTIRASATSFYGDPIAVWRRQGNLPVLLSDIIPDADATEDDDSSELDLPANEEPDSRPSRPFSTERREE